MHLERVIDRLMGGVMGGVMGGDRDIVTLSPSQLKTVYAKEDLTKITSLVGRRDNVVYYPEASTHNNDCSKC